MKKISIITLVIITLFLCGFCFFCSAQTNISKGDSNTKDSIKIIPKIDTLFTMMLKPAELNFIWYLLGLQDEKPSTMKSQKDYLSALTKGFILKQGDSLDIKIIPNKEKIKK